MQIQEALQRFMVQLKADGRSPHTIGQYRRHVEALAAWARHGATCGEVAVLGHEDVATFLAAPVARTGARGQPKRAATMNALRTSLRMFFRYLHEAGIVSQNPARLVRRATSAPPPPKALSDGERERLLAALAHGPSPRDHAIFHLLLSTGIRVGSAIALDVEDVDFENREVRLRNMKGDRRDVVFLGHEICEHLWAYVGDRRSGALFPGRNSKRITARQIQRRMRHWLAMAQIQRPASPHTCRHTFATRLLHRVGDLAVVQAALCHRRITSTMVYARVDSNRVRAALA